MELYKDKEWLKSKLDKTNLEIAKECGCSKSTIRYWIEKFGLSRNDKGINTYKNKEWLEEKFKTLKYAKTIGDSIGVSDDCIEYWREKFNIEKCEDSAVRKYFYNQKYFENIDNEEKAYWLGFIMADGAITKSNKDGIDNRLSIVLKSNDINHLKKFQKSIESNQPIKIKNVNSKGHISEICELRFNSIKLCEDLKKYGITSNKTGKEIIPDIKKDLIKYFIRGFFDGDGCLYQYKKYLNVSICSASYNLISQIKDIMISIGIHPYIENRSDKKEFYVIGTKKQSSVKNFLDYIYKNSTIYLDRKYEKYLIFYNSSTMQ